MSLDLMTVLSVTGGKLYIPLDYIPPATALLKHPITGVSIDSRTIKPDNIYIVLKGARFDGHDFVAATWQLGSLAAIVETAESLACCPGVVVDDTQVALTQLARWTRQNSQSIPWIAITGSNGKTTSRSMLAAILAKHYGQNRVLQPIRNFNNHIGVPLTILQYSQQYCAVVLELGTSKRGEIAALAELSQPNLGLISSIAAAHLDGLGSLQGVAEEKAALFSAIPKGAAKIYPSDCCQVDILRYYAGQDGISFGLSSQADFYATEVRFTNQGMRFCLEGVDFDLPLFGQHNVVNALGAILAARQVGVSLETAAAALADFCPVTGRFQLQDCSGVSVINDAYNANPASFQAALTTLRKLCQLKENRNRRCVVIAGDMIELGEETESQHHYLGVLAADCGVNNLITVGTKSQNCAFSFKQHAPRAKCRHFANVEELCQNLHEVIEYGDIVLIKGSNCVGLHQVPDKIASQVWNESCRV